MIRSVVAAAVLVLVVSAADASAAAPITIRPSIAPSRASFGDTVVARITIELDAESVSAATLDVAPSFGPYVELGAPRIERRRSGGKETVTYSYSIQCLTDGCLPGKESAVVRFPRVTVTGRSSARTVRASASWPALTVRSRLAPADLSRAPRFRRPATVPPPSFAVPGALTVLLVALAALLGVSAVVLLGLEGLALRRTRRRAAFDRLSPLERAIALTREAAGRADPGDRRKALSRLAEALDGAGATGLARSAGHAAWAETPPTPPIALEFAERAEPHRMPEPA